MDDELRNPGIRSGKHSDPPTTWPRIGHMRRYRVDNKQMSLGPIRKDKKKD